MDKIKLKNVVEAILVASDRILNLGQIEKLLTEKTVSASSAESDSDRPLKKPVNRAANDSSNETVTAAAEEKAENAEPDQLPVSEDDAETPESSNLKRSIQEVIEILQNDYTGRAMELKEVASGYRFQVRQDYAEQVGKLWEERPSKYSRALLETLVLIAYRQPITRGEIESIRGVSVSSHIIKTLVEREWVRVIGHRDVPGRPSIYGSTKEFLDYFNLKSLDELPTLAEIKDLDKMAAPELALSDIEEALAKIEAGDDKPGSVAGVQDTANNINDRQKIENRRNRRTNRMRRLSAESEQNESENIATSQENEPEDAELS